MADSECESCMVNGVFMHYNFTILRNLIHALPGLHPETDLKISRWYVVCWMKKVCCFQFPVNKVLLVSKTNIIDILCRRLYLGCIIILVTVQELGPDQWTAN